MLEAEKLNMPKPFNNHNNNNDNFTMSKALDIEIKEKPIHVIDNNTREDNTHTE